MEYQNDALQRLDQLVAGGISLPTVVELASHDVVILGASRDTVELWDNSYLVHQPDGAMAMLVTAPDRVHQALQRAVLGLNTQRLEARQELEAEASQHQAMLDKIRSYAIRRHEHSVICRDGLDGFLEAFNLRPYDPRCAVSVLLTGRCDVDKTDPGSARYAAETGLVLQTSGIAGLRPESVTSTTTVTGLAAHPQEPTRLQLTFVVRATFVCNGNDADYVGASVLAYLGVDLTSVPGIVLDAANTSVKVSEVTVELLD